MKKRFILAPVFAVVLSVFALTGCKGPQEEGDYSKYVTLGNIENIEVFRIHPQASEREIREYKDEALSEFMDYEDTDVVAYGNSVDCELIAKEGEEILYDFTGEDNSYEFIVGDAEFGSELDTQLVGKNLGEEFSFSTTIEENLEDTSLAGREVSFEVKIMNISKIIYPSLTDAFVKENFDCDTVEEWNQSILDEVQADMEAEEEALFRDNVAKEFAKRCTFSGYSDSLYKKMLASYESEYTEYAEMFGCSVEEIYDMFETSHAELEKQALEATNEQMALEVWLASTGHSFTDQTYDKKAKAYADEMGYDSVEELEEDYDKEELKTVFIRDEAIDFLLESSIMKVIEE